MEEDRVWLDNDDKIMDILDNIETENKGCFPVVCPICGKKEGHLYFHRNMEGDERGSMGVWCSACYHFSHAMYRLPKWWQNSKKINFEKLTSFPNYLEENKVCIDQWINEILFLDLASIAPTN